MVVSSLITIYVSSHQTRKVGADIEKLASNIVSWKHRFIFNIYIHIYSSFYFKQHLCKTFFFFSSSFACSLKY